MYRLLLLDDEEIVIKGIQKVFRLPEYGFEVVGTFQNPQKALESLEDLRPDLIITDVKMPQMDGLEFSRAAKQILPDAEIVILSGHDDFSFAQAAVKIGVSDYLLKPIKKDDFVTMLQQMHEKIEKKQTRISQYNQLQELVQNSYIELKNRFYLGLSEENHYDENLYEMLKKHGQTELEEEPYLLVMVGMDQVSTSGDYMSEVGKLTREIELALADFGDVLDFWSDESLYFVLRNIPDGLEEEVPDAVRAMVEAKKNEGMVLTAAVSFVHRGLGELFAARNDCFRQIFLQTAHIDETSDANPGNRQELNLTIPYTGIENLFQAISLNDHGKIDEIIQQIYENPGNNTHILYRDYVSSITFLILLRIYQMQDKYEATDEIAKQELLDLKNLRREYPSVEEQKQLVRETSVALAELISTQKVAAPSKMIQTALGYINEHFGENISLQDVADNISISKNYLCDLFKKEIGVTFINYVTNLRIEKAKEYLANTDMKMYEVSYAVGYNDYAYFSQIFKKHTGITLSAYRKTL